jgi:hypothetical protein
MNSNQDRPNSTPTYILLTFFGPHSSLGSRQTTSITISLVMPTRSNQKRASSEHQSTTPASKRAKLAATPVTPEKVAKTVRGKAPVTPSKSATWWRAGMIDVLHPISDDEGDAFIHPQVVPIFAEVEVTPIDPF